LQAFWPAKTEVQMNFPRRRTSYGIGMIVFFDRYGVAQWQRHTEKQATHVIGKRHIES
jgi:hypothetical protein